MVTGRMDMAEGGPAVASPAARRRAYRGEDRRAQAQADSRERSWLLAGAVVVAVLAVILGPALPRIAQATGPGDVAAVQVAVALLAAGLACNGVFHWSATGLVAGVWVAGAAAVLVLSVVADLVTGPGAGGAAAAGASAVAGGHLVVASASSQIDSRLRPRTLVPIGLAAGIAAALLGAAATRFGADLVVGLAVSTWLVILLLGGASAWTGTSLLLGWAAVGAAPLALAEVAGLPEVQAVMPPVLKPVLQGLGLVVIAAGTTFDLARSVRRHRSDTLDREVMRRTFDESRRMAAEDRNHDLGNALMALEGATLTLARLQDHLTVDQRAELAEAVAREAVRVRRLTAAEAADRATTRLDLRELVDRQATLLRANGVAVQVHGADAAVVEAHDGDLHQILHNLFTNAQRHGGADLDHPVRVSVVPRQDTVTVRVHDQGPGVPAAVCEDVFSRGVRASPQVGQGLGLTVARRLARQHGGELRLLPSERGACFELSLPAADVLSSV